jgi:energy-coupling factor transport system ATP-binding protein
MIELQGVNHTAHGPAGPFPALKDINLQLERGESVALMGANGSGKSSLCRCVNGLLLPQSGSVTVDGHSTRDADSCIEVRRRVGMVFQDPSQQLITWSVAEEIAFGLENLGRSAGEIEGAVNEGLARWRLNDLGGRHPLHLSGGQMAAVALASVLAMAPSYLVVDEPSSLLDRGARERLLDALGKIRKEGEIGLLWVTQFPEEAILCDRLVVICRGGIVADGAPREILSRVGDLKQWGLVPTPATLVSHRLLKLGVGLDRVHVGTESLLAELRSLGLKASSRGPQPSAARDSEALIRLAAAGYDYAGASGGVKGLDLDVCPGEGVGLAGPSGSGKSTAVYLASGAVKPTAGTVTWRADAGSLMPVGLCSQFPEEQFCAPTVVEEVGLGIPKNGASPAGRHRRALECLELVGFEPGLVADRAPLSLSEGEKKKVALATALAPEGALLVLDEPTLGLDGPSAELAVKAVIGHLEAGGAALIASHSGDFLLRTTARLAVLGGGSSVPVRWEEKLGAGRGSAILPEGQFLDLCFWCAGRPSSETLRSTDLLSGWLAGRLRELAGSLPERAR